MTRSVLALFLLVPLAALAEAPTVAVVPLSARDSDLGTTVTDTLETVLAEGGQVTLVERARIQQAVESITISGTGGEKLLGVSHAISEKSGEDVLKKIAAQTGAAYLVVGSIGDLGAKRVVNARLSEAASGKVLVAKSVSFANKEGIDGAVRSLAAVLLEKLAAAKGEAPAAAVGDEAQRALEQALASELRARYCGKDALEAGTVQSFAAGEVKVRLAGKGAQVEDQFTLLGAGGKEKGTVTLTSLGKDGRDAKGSFVNGGESMQLPAAGDVLSRGKVKLALVPLFSQVSLARDPAELAQAVEDRLSDEEGCEFVHQDAAALAKYQKAKAGQRAALARAGVSAVVEWTVELSGENRQVVSKVAQLPKGTLRGEFAVPLAK